MTEPAKPRISVAGAGVIGLTCAVRLAEAGYEVNVLARDLPLETTSSAAGGHWGPFLAEPAEDVTRWARRTFRQMQSISEEPANGIAMRTGYFTGNRMPSWAAALVDMMPLTRVTDEAPGSRGGWRVCVPIADMPVYLTYLMRRLRAAGGTITRLALSALPAHGVVINCTGLASCSLASDPSVRPVRGQVVVMSNPGGLTNWLIDTDADPAEPTYVFPQPSRIVIGGTVQPDEWSTEPDPVTAQQVLARATVLMPELIQGTVLAHRAALRPVRPVVRIETVSSANSAVVHCYGHGGSGITLSWGCADDVLHKVEALS